MTLEIKNYWNAVNRVLTIINLVLCMVLTGQGFDYTKVKDKEVPAYLNVALLFILSFGVSLAFYRLTI